MLRFLCIGGMSVLIDLIVFLILRSIVGAGNAKAISYVAGMLFGYVGNKLWTFEAKGKSLSEPLIYFALYASTLLVNVILNAATFDFLFSLFDSKLFAVMSAFVLATGVCTVLNFLGLRFVAFRRTTIRTA